MKYIININTITTMNLSKQTTGGGTRYGIGAYKRPLHTVPIFFLLLFFFLRKTITHCVDHVWTLFS